MNEKLINAILDPKVTFFMIATPQLKELIVQNEHPAVVGIPPVNKSLLLDGVEIVLDNKFLFNYITGQMDSNNKFVLDHCQIKVDGDFGVHLKPVK